MSAWSIVDRAAICSRARRGALLVAILVAILPAALDSQAPAPPRGRPPIPPGLLQQLAADGEAPVIVGVAIPRGFRPEPSLTVTEAQEQRASIQAAQDRVIADLAARGVRAAGRFDTIPFINTRVNAAALAALQNSPFVTSIEEDRLAQPTLAESVPLIGANVARASGYTGAGWTVAVLDTGVEKAHTFLSGKVVSEACYSNAGGFGGGTTVCPGGATSSVAAGSGEPCGSDCAHGTHVAGIAAGSGPSFSGVAPGASIISVQVFTRFTDIFGNYYYSSYYSDLIRALERVYALRSTYAIAAVNMSLGGGQYTSTASCDAANGATKAAIDNLRAVGIASVIASGNDGWANALSAPGCISSAVSVGSTGDGSGGSTADAVSSFSNSAAFLNLLAPGQMIYSSVLNGGFANYQGTSMATPHVAGAWAVLKQRRPAAGVSEVLSALAATGRPVVDSRNGLTFRRIDVAAALSAMCSYSVSPTSASFSAAGGAGTVSVTAASGCAWTATSHSGWLSITSGGSGTGNGTTTYAVASNTGSARSGSLTVAGVTVTVSQAGVPTFTDDPLTTSHPVRAIHMSELRQRIDALRQVRGLAGYVWTDSTITPGVTTARAIHVQEMRTALNQAYIAAGRTPPGYTDATLVAGVTAIQRIHIIELRDAVRALE